MTEPAFTYAAEVLEVHDGDTLTLRVDLGFRCAVTIQARVAGVNAPELRAAGGVEARDWLRRWLLPAEGAAPPVTVRSYRDRRSFARWVCDVWVGDRELAEALVAAGHAQEARR